jgi:hypothetical protein
MYTVEVYGLVMGVVFIAVFLFALAVAAFRMAKDYARATQAMRRITPLVFAKTSSEPMRNEFTNTGSTT